MEQQKTDRSLIEQFLVLLQANELETHPDFKNALEIKKFIDEIPGGFLIYYADSEEIIYANRALVKIFGCETLREFQSLTGNSFRGIVHRDDLDEVEKSISEQIAHSRDDLDYVEYRIVRKDGEIRWVEDYGHYVRTGAAKGIFYVFVSDATEKINRRHKEKNELINTIEAYDKERTLIRQEHLRRLEVIEGLSVDYESILYCDLDGDKLLPYRMSSRIETQFDGKLQVRPYSQILKGYISYWIHPEDKELVRERTAPDYIREHLSHQKSYHFNYRYVEDDGEIKFLQMRIVDVGKKDKISQVVLGIRNIDEEMLQELKQKQILQDALATAKRADAAKNAFLSNMSHDMRTPLNAILGFLKLAQNSLSNRTALVSYLEKIDTAGRQILDLVEKVLEFSYAEPQEDSVFEDECNLKELIDETYESLRPRFEQKNVAFVVDTKQANNLSVYADREKLGKILRHLIGNAVKFTQQGCVTVALFEEKAANGFAKYRFEVKDTGIGIEQDYLEKIFEPFERVSNTTMSGIYGAGLGLTICKQLTEMLGGTVEASSVHGEGSTFTLNLSLRLQDKNKKKANAENAYDRLKGRKILLVEDNEINREIETEILQNFGFVVDTAENGQIAVDKMIACNHGDYDLVLMDIQMPVMDGREATHVIRTLDDKEKANIPIIALSANAFESDKRASMEIGMDEHLPKPIDVELLLKTIADILADDRF